MKQWAKRGDAPVSRREALALFGTAGVAIVTAACSSGGSDDEGAGASRSGSGSTGSGGSASSGTGSSGSGASSGSATTSIDCVLTSEMTEGPFYLDDQVIRRDVTEGKTGIPLRLELTVADVATCTPAPGLMVEIWHCDAEGIYSGFGSGGSTTTFLRGGQTSDGSGIAVLDTIYPGWYPGRAVHIHLKVHDGNTVHTTQLFFDQDLNEQLQAQSPYKGASGMTTNSQDSIFGDGGSTTILRMVEGGDGYVGELTLGVRR